VEINFVREPALRHLRCKAVLIRGGYDPHLRKIELVGECWCRKTLVHETFHTLSYFTRDENLVEKFLGEWRFVVEGLTEFLTGIVLYSERHTRLCYERWLAKTHCACSISYEAYVRIFGALSHVVLPLDSYASIFLYRRGVDWNESYRSFLARYKLPDILRDWEGPSDLEALLLDGIEREYGREKRGEFEKLLEEDLEVVLNYGRMVRGGVLSSSDGPI